MTIRSSRARREIGICLIALSRLVLTLEHVVGDEPKSPRVVIVVANEAPRLERFAASELQSILSRLFEADVAVRPQAVEDAADSYGATARELKSNRKNESLRHAETAYKAIRKAIEAYVAVALMNEYCYRPIRDNGLPVIAKTPQLERAEVAKLLECGIVGIQLPRSETRAELETLLDYMRFPPDGTRAIAPGYESSRYVQPPDWKNWMAEQDEETTLVVHIETRVGYQNAEEIISTPNVDMVYVRPGDFSIEMGHPGDYEHPNVAGPMEDILAIYQQHGVAFGTTPSSTDAARKWVDRGARFFETIDELTLIVEGDSKLVRDYREFTG